jgi:hypothetical protein
MYCMHRSAAQQHRAYASLATDQIDRIVGGDVLK